MKRSVLVIFFTMLSQLVFASSSEREIVAYGKLFELNKQSNKYDIDLRMPCKVRAFNFKNSTITVYGATDNVIIFDYEIEGLPSRLNKYSSNTAKALVTSLLPLSGEKYFEGSFLTSGVSVSIDFNPMAEGNTQLSINRATMTSENAAASYLGRDGVKWSYSCKISQQ